MSTSETVRIGTRRDFHALTRAQGEWLDAFCRAHPAAERWCPAQVDVPRIADNGTLLSHLPWRESDRWTALLESDGHIDAYVLCRTDAEKKELSIEGHTPRVPPRANLDEAGAALLELVRQQAAERGLGHVRMGFHGVPDEVDPLIRLCESYGFERHLRLEMVSRRLEIDPGPQRLQFRSAHEIGEDALLELEAELRGWSVERARKNLAVSRKMWSAPSSDWLGAYEGKERVGTVRMAVTREGVGVLDDFALLEPYRGRGLGIHLLAGGLARLAGKAEVVWLDVDHDNVPARRVYERAGFEVLHHHGTMTMEGLA